MKPLAVTKTRRRLAGGSRSVDRSSRLALCRFDQSLLKLQLRRASATLHDLAIALAPIGAELVWMGTVAASGEHSVLVERIVELRVVRQKNCRAGGGGFCGHMLLRVDIGLEILDARVRRVVHEIESGAARVRDVDRPAAVRHGKSVGQRARRMPRR